MRRMLCLLHLLALALLGGCKEEITGVCVVATFRGIEVDQLVLELRDRLSNPLLEPVPRPSPARPLRSPQDFCVYLDDSFAGEEVTCRAKGLAQGVVNARGGATVILEKGRIIDCAVTLAQTPTPGDVPGCADGTREGFLNETYFRNVAACGADGEEAIPYQRAKSSAGRFCQAGWHWCPPAGMTPLGDSPLPGYLGDQSFPCAWLDRETNACSALEFHYGSSACVFRIGDTTTEGAGACNDPTTTGPVDCDAGWRVAAALHPDWWVRTAMRDGAACRPHVALRCAADPAGPQGTHAPHSCWVACCKD